MTTFSNKYRLEARLGGGGMAEVFVASMVGAEGFSRRVAIKRVLPGFSHNQQFSKMFIDEAKISSRLQHPNVVSVLDFDRDTEGQLYLVMELVEGKDLDALASTGPLPLPVVIFVISEVLRGLGHAHDLPVVDDAQLMSSQTVRSLKGVVHRDVSPHNVLLSWQGAVKVSDFGIAKARTADNATASVFIKGKPAYMSPEQANGEQLDGRSDLFAVGVMLWEMLCGQRLFVGDDTRATLAAVLFGQIPRPRSIRPDVPKDLERVAMKLLERDLKMRYRTAEEAIADLLACDAAPRNGREQLKRAMAERFPYEAPVRHSMMQQRGDASAPIAAPHLIPSHAQPPLAHGPAGLASPAPLPAHAVPSLGAMQPVATATMRPPALIATGPRRARTYVVLATAAVVVAVVLVAIVASRNGSASMSATHDASVQVVAADHGSSAADMAPAPDAAPEQAAVVESPVLPTTPIDGGVIDSAPAARQSTSHGQPIAARVEKYGQLQITAFPALTVYIDKKKMHDTPFDEKLPVGKHTVRLMNRDSGHDESFTVTIQQGNPVKIHRE